MSEEPVSPQILRITLGVEELALTLGLISRVDLGNNILASAYENLTEEQIQAHMTTAGHSLIARGLCNLTERNTLHLREDLEQAVFPLSKFDYLLRLNILRGDFQDSATIHVQQKRVFTSHFVRSPGIHYLEYASIEALPTYLAGIFTPVENGNMSISHPNMLTLAGLGEIQKNAAKPQWIEKMLTEAQWPRETAKTLSTDLKQQTLRATLLRVNATGETPIENLGTAPQQALLILDGTKNRWVFEFPAIKDETSGQGIRVSQAGFEEKLAYFVNGVQSGGQL